MEVTNEIICRDMLSLLGRFKQEMGRIAEERGLTHVQLAALYMVHQHGELAMGEVAHVLHCDPSNVTGVVDRLVSHKLVNRQESTRDRRAKTITLTEQGGEIVAEIMRLLPGRMGCDRLSQQERHVLHVLVQKIAA